MKRIGIDARLINQTGVGVYIRNLLHHLQLIAPRDTEFYIYVLSNDKSRVMNSKFKIRIADYKWHSINEQIGFLNALNHDNLDLVHFTYFSCPIFYKKPFIITIHDLTPLLFRTGKASTRNLILYEVKHSAYRILLTQAIRNALSIITPTQTVAGQIIDSYPFVNPEKIHVTYEGVGAQLKKGIENKALSKQFQKPFFIYVGNFYPHKNIERLLEAYAKVPADSELILIGPMDYFAKRIVKLIDLMSLSKKVRLYHCANTGDMIFFYKNAQALIHPSLSEGFGLPIVEATYFGLPIIASDILVFNELLGNSYTPFNPNDVRDIITKINKFQMTQVHPKPVMQKNLSYARMAKQTLLLYQAHI